LPDGNHPHDAAHAEENAFAHGDAQTLKITATRTRSRIITTKNDDSAHDDDDDDEHHHALAPISSRTNRPG
jgi:hypothetical protein